MPDGKRESDDNEKYHRTQMQKEMILEALKEKGCRITKQRGVLLNIILENDCSSCKEIFYKASQQDRRGHRVPYGKSPGRDRGHQPEEHVQGGVFRRMYDGGCLYDHIR